VSGFASCSTTVDLQRLSEGAFGANRSTLSRGANARSVEGPFGASFAGSPARRHRSHDVFCDVSCAVRSGVGHFVWQAVEDGLVSVSIAWQVSEIRASASGHALQDVRADALVLLKRRHDRARHLIRHEE
jgi:hypothetical protein